MGTSRQTLSRWTVTLSGRGSEEVASARDLARREERILVEQAKAGDEHAFEQLVHRHQRRILSLIGHTIRRSDDAEDLAQQVFMKVYLALPKFDFRAEFSTWVYRITVNECYDYMRRQRALKSAPGNEFQVGELADLDRMSVGAAQKIASPAKQAELKQTVELLFARLAPEDRLLLTLRELEGYSMGEMAKVLDIKENTVKVRLFRARKRLVELHKRLME